MSSQLADLHKLLDTHVQHNIHPRGRGNFHYKSDWSGVECRVLKNPAYVYEKSTSKSVFKVNQKFTNHTSTPQRYELSEMLQSHNQCTVQVQSGVKPGAATLKLKTPSELISSGVPEVIYLSESGSLSAEKVSWAIKSAVKVPADSTVNIEISGEEQVRQGTFKQVQELSGTVCLRFFDGDGVFRFTENVNVKDLANGKSVKLSKDGVQFTLGGTCTFHVSQNNQVHVTSD